MWYGHVKYRGLGERRCFCFVLFWGPGPRVRVRPRFCAVGPSGRRSDTPELGRTGGLRGRGASRRTRVAGLLRRGPPARGAGRRHASLRVERRSGRPTSGPSQSELPTRRIWLQAPSVCHRLPGARTRCRHYHRRDERGTPTLRRKRLTSRTSPPKTPGTSEWDLSVLVCDRGKGKWWGWGAYVYHFSPSEDKDNDSKSIRGAGASYRVEMTLKDRLSCYDSCPYCSPGEIVYVDDQCFPDPSCRVPVRRVWVPFPYLCVKLQKMYEPVERR